MGYADLLFSWLTFQSLPSFPPLALDSITKPRDRSCPLFPSFSELIGILHAGQRKALNGAISMSSLETGVLRCIVGAM